MLIGACQEPAYPGPEYEVRPAATDLWSGTRVDFYSQAFADHAAPLFILNDTTLPAVRVDDTTFTVPLPVVRGQITIDVRFQSPGDTVTVGPLTLYGFRDARLGPPLKGTPRIWPGPPNILLVGATGLVQYDLRHNVIARSWSDSLHDPRCNVSAGVSFRSRNHAVLQRRSASGACGPPVSWDLWPEPVSVDSTVWGCCAWALVEMAPERWLVTRDDFFVVLDHGDGTWQRREFRLTTERAAFSPRGDRVALPGWSMNGPYVVDPASGDTAYSLPMFREGEYATFSPDGDTLLMTGYVRPPGPGQSTLALVRLRAVDGALLDSVTLPPGFSGSVVALDPLANLIYVAGIEELPDLAPPPDSPWPHWYEPALMVFRRASLEPVALLRVPPTDDISQPNPGPGWDLFVVPSPMDALVYVLLVPWSYDAPVDPITVYRFDRLP